MRLGAVPKGAPLWPPLLATRGVGAASGVHAHHAMHVVLAERGLRVRAGRGAWVETAGVVTAPDVAHEIDARGGEVLLVFIDPESDVGEALRGSFTGSVRIIGEREREEIDRGEQPMELMKEGGVAWTRRAVEVMGGEPVAARARVHPRVRRVLRHLRRLEAGDDMSLASLAEVAGLSSGRLMHAFTESIGVPLRPYLAWLRLQRAAAAIVGGAPLSDAAVMAGFSDAAHMSRTFRRMLGMAPSMLQPVRSRPGAAAEPG